MVKSQMRDTHTHTQTISKKNGIVEMTGDDTMLMETSMTTTPTTAAAAGAATKTNNMAKLF